MNGLAAAAAAAFPVRAAPVIWSMTTGENGMRSQAGGLARRLALACGGVVEELVIGLRRPWSFLPGALSPSPWMGLRSDLSRPRPPWPDILVTCGRRSTAISIAIRRASRGRTFTVHIGHPRTRSSAFDLVFPMAHDGLGGPNVTPVRTTLHAITPARLLEAAEVWTPVVAGLARPLLGVAMGGSTRRRIFSLADARALFSLLARFRIATGGAVVVTLSRRTPEAVRAFAAEACAEAGHRLIDDQAGPGPYLGLLALSDRILVTSDSVSMISEALAGPAPVEVFDLELGGRHGRFLDGLLTDRLVRLFDPESPPVARDRRVDAADLAVERTASVLRSRGAPVSGSNPKQG